MDMTQQGAGQFSLRAFQIASPQFMDMFGAQKDQGLCEKCQNIGGYCFADATLISLEIRQDSCGK